MSLLDHARLGIVSLIATAAILLTVALPTPARAEATPPEGIQRVIETAREAGVSIIVLDGSVAPAAAEAKQELGLAERAEHRAHAFSVNLKQMVADLAAAPESLPVAIAAASSDGTTSWIWLTLVATVIALLAGWGVERAAGSMIASKSRLAAPAEDAARSERIRLALIRAIIDGVVLAVGLCFAFLLAISLTGRGEHHRAFILSIFEAVVYARVFLLFFRSALVTSAADGGVLGIPQAAGQHIYTRLSAGLWSAAILAVLLLWLTRIGAAQGLVSFVAIVTSLVVAITFGKAAWAVHRAMPRSTGPGARRPSWLLRNWHLAVTLYLCLAVAVTGIGRLAGAPISGIVIAPVTAAILASVLYTVFLLFVDAGFGAPKATDDPRAPSFRRWAERSALTIAISIAACVVLGAWGVGFVRDDGTVRPVYTILLISIVAYIGWSAIHTAFDKKIAEERGAAGTQLDDVEEGGAGGTRLATLLPLLRNAILIAILVLAFMVVLSAIGVDVAPLFAGAGLIGFAVGFGAQTLVRDIFSGVFFLVDDAFRVGEYIETGAAKGTVERISIRSMQLRHQNGPLNTIPFGEITQLTNYSRDWVIMKLPIRVRFGTDTERIRKLIKKLGTELLEHPLIGDKFIEPLKSQGVYQMDEFGIVTRVKFKTKPGDQFAVRKTVYQKINELFEQEGIAFGGREVIVRAADDGKSERPSLDRPEVTAAATDAAGDPPTAPA